MIDYEILRGRQNETIVKELYVAIAALSETLRFKSPYEKKDHGSPGNGLNSTDVHIDYKESHKAITDAVAAFAHVYFTAYLNVHSSQDWRDVRSIT